VAAHMGLKVPRSFDLVYEAKERGFKLPNIPHDIRTKAEEYMTSDMKVWRHARSLVYQRAVALTSSLKNAHHEEPIACMEYACRKTLGNPVPVLGARSNAQLSDHICEVNPSCDWSVEIPSVHRIKVTVDGAATPFVPSL
jgi:hypothetical protein